MVLTDPEYRRRGLARILMEHALAFLDARGVRCAKLDATSMGQPLYEQLGFRAERAIERWRRAPARFASADECEPFQYNAALDCQAFGADRWALIEALAPIESAALELDGFAMSRPGTHAAYFGPCVAASTDCAERLLRAFLAKHSEEPVYWDLLPQNPAAAQLAHQYGFAPMRRLIRMTRGDAAIDQDISKVFAIAGFEYG